MALCNQFTGFGRGNQLVSSISKIWIDLENSWNLKAKKLSEISIVTRKELQ